MMRLGLVSYEGFCVVCELSKYAGMLEGSWPLFVAIGLGVGAALVDSSMARGMRVCTGSWRGKTTLKCMASCF